MKLKFKQKIGGTVAAVILLLYGAATSADALTVDRMHVSKAVEGAQGAYRVTSMDESLMKGEHFRLNSQMGNYSSIHVVREEGEWDKDFLLTSRYYTLEDQGVQNSLAELKHFMKTLDNILPDEKIIVICYWLDFQEITIYFAPERWQDEKFHKDLVQKLKL